MTGVVFGQPEPPPREVELAPGFFVTVRTLTTLDHEIAEARAQLALTQLVRGAEALAPYGLDRPDLDGKQFDPRDQGQAFAIGVLVQEVELALLAFVSWRGAVDAEGAPAPINRETLMQLFRAPAIAKRAHQALQGAALSVRLEGNGSGLSAGGSSTPTEGPDTAAAAAPQTRPAAGAFAGEGANSALPSSTPPGLSGEPSSGSSSNGPASGETEGE